MAAKAESSMKVDEVIEARSHQYDPVFLPARELPATGPRHGHTRHVVARIEIWTMESGS